MVCRVLGVLLAAAPSPLYTSADSGEHGSGLAEVEDGQIVVCRELGVLLAAAPSPLWNPQESQESTGTSGVLAEVTAAPAC